MEYLDNNNTLIGISDAKVSLDNSNLTCQYVRENSVKNPRYFDIDRKDPYVLVAYGKMRNNGLNY